jgi:hypothetical protein
MTRRQKVFAPALDGLQLFPRNDREGNQSGARARGMDRINPRRECRPPGSSRDAKAKEEIAIGFAESGFGANGVPVFPDTAELRFHNGKVSSRRTRKSCAASRHDAIRLIRFWPLMSMTCETSFQNCPSGQLS